MRLSFLRLFLALMVPASAFAQQAPPPAVVIALAQLTDLSESVAFNGRLEADQRIDLRARVSGALLEVTFQPGDVVQEGDVLFRIEQTAYKAAVQQAEGALKTAEAQTSLAQVERDRQQQLVAKQAAAEARLDEAEAALGSSEGVLAQQQAALDLAQLNLSYTEIRAPFSGRVGISSVDVGALVGPETGALASLTALDPIHANFPVSTAALRAHRARVEAGTASNQASASLILANGDAYATLGDIDFVDVAVDGATDTVTMRAKFPNSEAELLDGELVRVVLTSADAQTVLTIPQRGVQRDLQGAFVMTVTGANVVEMRRVDVDRIVDGIAVIADGLSEGDRVIIDGVNKVRPGITVDAATSESG